MDLARGATTWIWHMAMALECVCNAITCVHERAHCGAAALGTDVSPHLVKRAVVLRPRGHLRACSGAWQGRAHAPWGSTC